MSSPSPPSVPCVGESLAAPGLWSVEACAQGAILHCLNANVRQHVAHKYKVLTCKANGEVFAPFKNLCYVMLCYVS